MPVRNSHRIPRNNAILVSGDPASRNALVELVRSFDVDLLAGQSYALLPVPPGAAAKDFAGVLQDAFRGQAGGGLSGLVRVLPLEHAGSVLVVASQPSYINQARRVYALIQQGQRATLRSWHVYYLQNSHAEDIAYLLQRAFTPNDVTAQPAQTASPAATQLSGQAPGNAGTAGSGAPPSILGGQGGGQYGGGQYGGGGAPPGLTLLSSGGADPRQRAAHRPRARRQVTRCSAGSSRAMVRRPTPCASSPTRRTTPS